MHFRNIRKLYDTENWRTILSEYATLFTFILGPILAIAFIFPKLIHFSNEMLLIIILAITALPLIGFYLIDSMFLNISEEIEGNINSTHFPTYLSWERNYLSWKYPKNCFILAGKLHIASIVPAPASISDYRTGGEKAFQFDELIRLSNKKENGDFIENRASWNNPARTLDLWKRRIDAILYIASCKRRGLIRRADKLGFEPLKWNIDDKEFVIDVGVARYRAMAATTWLLRLELYENFLKDREPDKCVTPRRNGVSFDINKLTYRCNSLRPTLGVQALTIVVKDNTPEVIMFDRSVKTSSRQGWHQFIPSGGHEVFGEIKPDLSTLEKHTDPGRSLAIECIEELLGSDKFQGGYRMGTHSIFETPEGRELIEPFKHGRAKIRFLGVVTDAVMLRPELSFVIFAKDPGWNYILGEEAGDEISPRTFGELAEFLKKDDTRLNPSSAALLRLAIDSGAISKELPEFSQERLLALFGDDRSKK